MLPVVGWQVFADFLVLPVAFYRFSQFEFNLLIGLSFGIAALTVASESSQVSRLG